ncbi:MAG: hypothetical protein VKK80_04850 [Prochlorothrix sp.]|nr:hypothetical protein [Prochlorothrix sp.]
MQTIQLQVEVKADRSLTIPLPSDCAAGLYEVVVVMNPQARGAVGLLGVAPRAAMPNPTDGEGSISSSVSFAELAHEFIGCLDSDLEDLSYNSAYMKGFGE